jgi:hypothetical protein
MGNATIKAKLYKNGVFQSFGTLRVGPTASGLYGAVLVFLSIIAFMTILGMGLSGNPILTVIFLMVGAIMLFALNLVSNNGFLGAGATILWFIIAGILLLIKGARRN